MKKITRSHCAWERGTARISESMHRCQRQSLPATPRFYATIGEIFYYQRSAKNRGKKSETESVVNVQLKSRLRASTRRARLLCSQKLGEEFPSGEIGTKYFVVSITQKGDDDASAIDFRSSAAMIHACAQRWQRTLHKNTHIFVLLLFQRRIFENEKWTRTTIRGAQVWQRRLRHPLASFVLFLFVLLPVLA